MTSPDPLARVRRNALLYYGEAGARWLANLDATVASARDALALDALPSHACVDTLAHDDAHLALLLERVSPGDPLDGCADTASLAATLDLMERLHVRPPEGHAFPTVATWCEGLAHHRAAFGGAGPLPRDLFEAAESLAADLLAEADSGWLLHGDLHHANVLHDATRDPIAIDPKGVVGPRVYELCAWMRNPPGFATDPQASGRLARRVDQATERAWVERDVLIAWGLCSRSPGTSKTGRPRLQTCPWPGSTARSYEVEERDVTAQHLLSLERDRSHRAHARLRTNRTKAPRSAATPLAAGASSRVCV